MSVLTTLARIHATWSDGRADAHGWLPKVDDPCSAGMVAMFDDAYPVTMERYGHVIPTICTTGGHGSRPPPSTGSPASRPSRTRFGEELFLSMWRRGFQVAERLDLTSAVP